MHSTQGILVFALTCLAFVHSGTPDDHYNLQYIVNTTTSVYNGTDLSNPLTLTNLHLWMYSDTTPELNDATQAVSEDISRLKANSLKSASPNVEGKGFSLVFSENITEIVILGPKYSSVINVLSLNMWKRK